MSELTVRDGKLLVRDEKLGTEQECCCQGCDLSAWDTDEQPSVAVVTDCECNDGTHDGVYPYDDLGADGVLMWYGTTTCDWTGFPSDAEILIQVSQNCVVTVATYQFPFMSLQGSVQASQLTLNQDGAVVGEVQVPLFDLDNVLQCTATVTFG